MAKQTFTSGQTLTAQQVNDLQTNDFNMTVTTGTANYTLQVSDRGQRRVQNMGSAGTVTVPNSVFTAGDSLWLHSIGSGTQSVVAGAGLTLNSSAGTAPTLAQWEGGVVYFTSSSSAIFFRGGSKSTLSVEYLLVGGGGAGQRGGGGAGGFVTGSGIIGKSTYTVKVGAGGSATDAKARNGTASSFIGSANGGGGGGASAAVGTNGASGGGAGANTTAGTGISGEGNNGGTGTYYDPGPGQTEYRAGGGGGGAGGTGGNASGSSTATGGAGGAASTNSYTGSSISYSGGGGGGGAGTSGTGGTGGTNAGNGGATASAGTAATANRGGGGGGGGGYPSSDGAGANGGSGRVVVRWLTADATGLSISVTGTTTNGTDGSYTWYAWDSTGTLVVA